MKFWLLTSSWNLYDQMGDYFIAAFSTKPTVEELMEFVSEEKAYQLVENSATHNPQCGCDCVYSLNEHTCSN